MTHICGLHDNISLDGADQDSRLSASGPGLTLPTETPAAQTQLNPTWVIYTAAATGP